MNGKLSKNAQKIQLILNKNDLQLKVIEFPESTRTSKEAAEVVGCELGQIAKSIVFKGKESNKPVLVIASGKNRVNEKKIKEYMGEKIEKADANFVLQNTGFPIGGVPPVGHKSYIKPFIDEDLMEYDEIWAAAGTPYSVFKLTPKDLLKITDGIVASVKK